MKKFLPLLILIPIFAAGPAGVVVWKASRLEGQGERTGGQDER